MKNLRMEVQSYRDSNERLTRAQEEQNHVNTQLLQSLNQFRRN
jgi:hypothetical protein